MSPRTTSLPATQNHPGEAPAANSPDIGRDVANKPLRFAFSEGLMIALATGYAYLLSFQYEMGFTSYFGVPEQFIEVSLGNVLMLAGVALGFVFFIYWL